MNVVGPLARSAGDLEVALRVMAGPDELEAGAFTLTLRAPRHEHLAGHRVGIVIDDPVAEVDRSVQQVLAALGDRLRAAGVVVDDDAKPELDMDEVMRVYTLLLHSATSHRQTDEELADAIAAVERDAPSGSQVPRPLLGRTLRHRDWLDLNESRERMRWRWHEFFTHHDLLLAPVRPIPAHPHMVTTPPQDRRYEVNGAAHPHTEQVFWGGYSGAAYLPATIVPAGMTADGLPVGVQVIGPFGGDLTCLHFAQLLEREMGGFVAPPRFSAPPPDHERTCS